LENILQLLQLHMEPPREQLVDVALALSLAARTLGVACECFGLLACL
jgi:hypothetical protein